MRFLSQRTSRRSFLKGLAVTSGGIVLPNILIAQSGTPASRKVGNAVVRNRAKRRLRAAAASVLPALGQPGSDYVLIARAGTADRPFAELVADLEAALRRIGGGGAPRPSGAGRASLSHEASGEAHQARH